ncbi:MAG: efflux RND transporter periplasmic adaptor subunit [Clostridia bacterium]|nr:efflux RND transporter periplasmic adaptor subunit [Clostridia bacterium]
MKTWLKALIIIVLVIGLAVGGIFAYVHFSDKTPVEVQPAGNWMLHYMPNQSYIYGTVSSDTAQTIYAEEGRTVVEVIAQLGDEVSVGDPLLRYDTTLDAITLEEKKLEREKLYNELLGQYEEYERYARATFLPTIPSITPAADDISANSKAAPRYSKLGSVRYDLSEPTGGDGSAGNPYTYRISNREPVSASFLQVIKDEAAIRMTAVYARIQIESYGRIDLYVNPDATMGFEVTIPLSAGSVSANFQTPLSGDGREETPYVYSYASSASVPEGFLTVLIQEAQTILTDTFVVLDAGDFTVNVRISPDGSLSFYVTVSVVTPTPTASPTPSPEPTAEPTLDPYQTIDPSLEPTPEPMGGGGMSRAEREEYARQIAKDIRDKELKYRQLSHDILKLELSGESGIVYSSIEGVVTISNAPESSNSSEPILEIQGGSGCNISCIIGETELADYPIGTVMEGYSYMSGSDVSAQVVEISTMPISTNYSTNGSPNSSGYMVVLEVLDGLTLEIGEYIEFSSYEPLYESGVVYLSRAFIREMDGGNCIFVVRDGVLKQERVVTGKRMDNYVELVDSNLTSEDYIAFPYDKHCRDGAPYEIAEQSFYYGY